VSVTGFGAWVDVDDDGDEEDGGGGGGADRKATAQAIARIITAVETSGNRTGDPIITDRRIASEAEGYRRCRSRRPML